MLARTEQLREQRIKSMAVLLLCVFLIWGMEMEDKQSCTLSTGQGQGQTVSPFKNVTFCPFQSQGAFIIH